MKDDKEINICSQLLVTVIKVREEKTSMISLFLGGEMRKLKWALVGAIIKTEDVARRKVWSKR